MPLLQDVHGVSFNFEPGGALPFDALIDLEECNDVGTAEGAVALVGTFKSLWVKLLKSPPPVSDGVTVVPTLSGDGGWYRTIESPYWQTQATWYIDPATGDDENDGETTATALATWAEFTRRVKVINIGMTLTILSDITEALRATFETTATPAAWLWIKGQSTVLASGATSTFVDPVAATNSRGSVTVTDLTTSGGAPTDFAGYVGRLLRSPVDADGPTYFPVLYAAGGVAQGPFWARNLSNTKPVNGSLVEVLDLITAPTVEIATNGLPVRCTEIEFTTTASTALTNDTPFLNTLRTPQHSSSGIGSILLSAFVACIFNSTVQCTQSWFVSVLFASTATVAAISPMVTNCVFIGGGSLRPLYVVGPGRVSFQGFTIQGRKLIVGSTSNVTFSATSATVDATSASTSLGIFDSTEAGIEVFGGAQVYLGTIYGSGNTTYGMIVKNGGTVRISGTPYITGTSGDVQVEGAATAIPPLTATAAVPAASALATWAQWIAAPFSRKVFNYSTGSRIIG